MDKEGLIAEKVGSSLVIRLFMLSEVTKAANF